MSELHIKEAPSVVSRPSKSAAIRFARKWAPIYAQLFWELKREGGRVRFESPFSVFRQKIAAYVTLYDDERKIAGAIMKAFLGEQGLKKFSLELENCSESELAEFTEYCVTEEAESEISDLLDLPDSKAEWEQCQELFNSLSEDEKSEAIARDVCLFSGVFCQIFNVLALMTHGAKLTTLVQQALNGDDEAFCKAVQVDRYLLTHHPYFVERKRQAQDDGRVEFLRKLALRERNPNLQGRFQYFALFMLFGILESLHWLNDLSHEEILDLFDAAGLDRFQNRIEDVNYLTKRLANYRRLQKTAGVSMH